MRTRCSTTLVSILVMSVCLVAFIPGSLRFVSTWRDLYFDIDGVKEQNLFMPLGFYSLGLEMIGLIVLWTAYRRRERWAWFVMLIILVCFVFPINGLQVILTMQTPAFAWSYWLNGIRDGAPESIWAAVGALIVVVMSVALLLPIKAFFGRSARSERVNKEGGQPPASS